MRVVQLSDPAEFLRQAEPLLADEARHNLILGLAGTLRDHPTLYPDYGLWLVEDGGAAAGAALRTRPHNLVLARGVIPPRPTSGRPRPATRADRPLLLDWWRAFAIEALGETEPDEAGIARNVDHKLSTGGIELWEDEGRPVSAVGYGSPTPSGARIGPVYTPPDRRGNGYASALTAHVSAAQLAAGRHFCFLYTNLANPTANRIYVAIGYERVCASAEYSFVMHT